MMLQDWGESEWANYQVYLIKDNGDIMVYMGLEPSADICILRYIQGVKALIKQGKKVNISNKDRFRVVNIITGQEEIYGFDS